MKISALNNFYPQTTSNKIKKHQNANTNSNFEYSKTYSNAIKSNSLGSIAFCANKKITQADVLKKETQVRMSSIKAFSKLQNVYYLLAPQWLKEAKDLYFEAQMDYCNLDADNIRVIKSIENGKIMPIGFTKYDSLKRPLYSAELKEGKIEKISSYNINGDIDSIVKINTNKDVVMSYQKGFDFDGSYDFKIDFFLQENGKLTPDVYREGHRKDDLGLSYYDKVMLFIDGNEMIYREGVDKCTTVDDPNGQTTAIEFEFQNADNFVYAKGQSRSDGRKPANQGEIVRISDSELTYWSKGHDVYPDGIIIQSPRITLKKGNVIEYDEGYKLDTNSTYLQRHNYLNMRDGIPKEILKSIGYLK